MHDDVLSLFAARKGHFRFESGHHGDLWLEIAAAYVRPKRIREFAARLAGMLSANRVEAVCGPMVEGALLAQMVAEELDAEFCFAEQFSRSSSDGLFPIGYRVPVAFRSRLKGQRVAVVDDAINAGSAVRGAIEDLESCGARVVVIGSLMTLGNRASKIAAEKGASMEALATVDDNALWTPSACPLCAKGMALEGSSEPQ